MAWKIWLEKRLKRTLKIKLERKDQLGLTHFRSNAAEILLCSLLLVELVCQEMS